MVDSKDKYEIDLQQEIGKGAFGRVYACKKKGETDYNYVAKIIVAKSKHMSVLAREVKNAEIMKQKRHKNVLLVEEVEKTKDSVIIYTKYYKKRTLENYMDDKSILRIDEIKDFFTGILNGLHFFHQNGMVHRDMKNENVFLEAEDDKLIPVIGDLGFARDIQEAMDTVIGTPITMSPELLTYETYSESVDVWALGAMLYKMCFGTYPFEKGNLKMSVKRGEYILKGKILATVNSLQIIIKCLLRDPNRRPCTTDLLTEELVTRPLDDLQLVWIMKDVPFNINKGVEELKVLLNDKNYFYIINAD